MKKSLPFLVLAGLLTACAPASVICLRPLADETRFTDGLEAVKQEQKGLKIVTAFESAYTTYEKGRRADYLIFNTEVFNQTDQDLDVRPTDFRALVSDAKNGNLLSTRTGPDGQPFPLTYVALDPEQQLSETALKMKQEESRLKRNKILNTALFVALAAAEVSNSSNSRSYREFATNGFSIQAGFQAWAIKRVVDRQTFANRMDRLSWEQNNWRQETFRRTTLAPGASVRGRLLVRANPQAAYVWLTYPAPSGEIKFMFEQKLVRSSR